MIKLDDNLLAELGLHALPPEEKKNLLRHIYETLEMRVGTTLAQQMTDAQLDEFEGFINSNDEAGALHWLESNFPNYKDVVAHEFELLKNEVRQAAPQILASAAARPQPMPQQYQQPAQPQMQQPLNPYQQPQQPMPQQYQQYQQPMPPQPQMPLNPSMPQYSMPQQQPMPMPPQQYGDPSTVMPASGQPVQPQYQPTPTQTTPTDPGGQQQYMPPQQPYPQSSGQQPPYTQSQLDQAA